MAHVSLSFSRLRPQLSPMHSVVVVSEETALSAGRLEDYSAFSADVSAVRNNTFMNSRRAERTNCGGKLCYLAAVPFPLFQEFILI